MTEQLMLSFHISTSDLGWLGASFFYAYGIMQIPSGWMLDRYGARKMLTFYSLLCAFGLLLFALTEHFAIALLARFLAGTGVCIGFLASYNLAANWLPHRLFSSVAALLHTLGTIGAVLATGPMAMMVNHFGWRHSLSFLAMATLLLTIAYYFLIKDGKSQVKHKHKTEFFKALNYWLSHSQTLWIALIAFLAWLPVSIVGALWGVPYLMKAYHWDNVTASNICSLFWVGSGIGSFVLSWYSEAINLRKKPIILCFTMQLIASILFLFAPKLPVFLISVALLSLGISVCIQTMTFSLIKENVKPEYFTANAGLNNAVSMMSSVLGQLVVGIMLDWHRFARGGIHYQVSDYQYALFLIPCASVLGLLIMYFKIRETHCTMANPMPIPIANKNASY
jgi:predicted MFS family arabinose efflux permease